MSEQAQIEIHQVLTWIKWLAGGITTMIVGAFFVGSWVAFQQSEITKLIEADRVSLVDRSEIRGTLKGQNDVLSSLKQESALQSRDISYIRSSVEKMESTLQRQIDRTNGHKQQ